MCTTYMYHSSRDPIVDLELYRIKWPIDPSIIFEQLNFYDFTLRGLGIRTDVIKYHMLIFLVKHFNVENGYTN